MTEELLFSALGLNMDVLNEKPLQSPTTSFSYEYETPCKTPLSDYSELTENSFTLMNNRIECYTDMTYSPEVQWSNWSTNTFTSSSKYK